jgi:hypothetical protein
MHRFYWLFEAQPDLSDAFDQYGLKSGGRMRLAIAVLDSPVFDSFEALDIYLAEPSGVIPAVLKGLDWITRKRDNYLT